MIDQLKKLSDGSFEKNMGICTLHYDNKGVYIGQWQDDIYTGDPIYIPDNENINVSALTNDEMSQAIV